VPLPRERRLPVGPEELLPCELSKVTVIAYDPGVPVGTGRELAVDAPERLLDGVPEVVEPPRHPCVPVVAGYRAILRVELNLLQAVSPGVVGVFAARVPVEQVVRPPVLVEEDLLGHVTGAVVLGTVGVLTRDHVAVGVLRAEPHLVPFGVELRTVGVSDLAR